MSTRWERRADPATGKIRRFLIIDFLHRHPDGRRERIRKVATVQNRRGAEQEERQLRHAVIDGRFGRTEPICAPTLTEFKDRFIRDWCEAKRDKPSSIESKQSSFRTYLLPMFGDRRLDSFTAADEDRLKRELAKKSTSTYNNSASTLNVALKVAVRWKVIQPVPHRFALLKRMKPRPKFYDFDPYEALVEAAEKLDPRIELVVLLGGDGGLRRGEIIALEQSDVDLRRKQLTVERSEWKGQVTATKGMKYRVVPLTERLCRALAANRHLRGPRVLYTDAGKTVTAKVVARWMAKAQRLAGLRPNGDLHVLRHTFCSHLAMRGAPARSIQALAGHENLTTTLGYMHLAPGETTRAIALLDQHRHGNGMATERAAER